MSNFMDFSSDSVNAFELMVDSSGSMDHSVRNVNEGLGLYRRSFQNFPGAGSVVVSSSRFDDDVYLDDFRPVSEMNTDYKVGGATVLYYAIVKGAEHLKKYINQVTKAKGVVPRATFIVFSDGEPCQDKMSKSDAKKAIEDLNYAGVTTVFVAFGVAITSNFGKEMGFVSTIDVTEKERLVHFLGVELSKSCKEQSQSMKSLGANFFSQAANNTKSENFSQTTTQVLEDTSWIDDI